MKLPNQVLKKCSHVARHLILRWGYGYYVVMSLLKVATCLVILPTGKVLVFMGDDVQYKTRR